MPETIKKVPQRKCIGCNTSYSQNDLIRITLQNGKLQIDQEIKAEGRGCYVCKNSSCIEKAIKKNAFQRTFKRAFSKDEVEQIGRYLNAK